MLPIDIHIHPLLSMLYLCFTWHLLICIHTHMTDVHVLHQWLLCATHSHSHSFIFIFACQRSHQDLQCSLGCVHIEVHACQTQACPLNLTCHTPAQCCIEYFSPQCHTFEGSGDLIGAISLVLDGAHDVVSFYLILFLPFSFLSWHIVEAVMPPVALLGCRVLVWPMSRCW